MESDEIWESGEPEYTEKEKIERHLQENPSKLFSTSNLSDWDGFEGIEVPEHLTTDAHCIVNIGGSSSAAAEVILDQLVEENKADKRVVQFKNGEYETTFYRASQTDSDES
jgi:hypothetical protein